MGMVYLLTIWLLVQLISLICLPFSLSLFSALPDRGYSLNKSFSLIVFAYITWLIVSLHLLPFTQISIIIIGFLLALIPLIQKHHPRHLDIRHCLLTEIIFFMLFAFFAYLKYRTPAIYGTEKPMDFALINGIFRSHFFPPQDAWYANETINYYYFGHYLIAFLSKLTSIPTRIIYNLALPLIFALTGINIFSIITNFTKPKKHVYFLAFATITLVLLGSNLDTVLRLGKVINWWNPSRIIPNTITEFPYFSLILGDVHAHVLALVFGSLFLGICLAYFKKPTISILASGSLVLACLAMTNPWEIPGYLLVILPILFSVPCHRIRSSVIGILLLIFFSFPFLSHYQMIKPASDSKPLINFISNTSSIGRHTLLSELLIIWGTHIAILLSIVFFLRRKILSKTNIFPLVLCFSAITLILFCEFFFINDLFTAPLERMNTVFKFYYQAWLLFGIGSIALLSNHSNILFKNRIITLVIAAFFFGNLSYFAFATPTRLKEFPQKEWSLDGLKYMSASNPSDLAAIDWLNKNNSKSVNIVESAADPSGSTSYNSIGRISAATGLPTILGWANGHEDGLWRSGGQEIINRTNDVRTIYESNDSATVETIINKYSIKYIIVGEQEKLAYPKGNFHKFNLLGYKIFVMGSTTIYQVL